MEKSIEKFANKSISKSLIILSYPSLISMVSTASAQMTSTSFAGLIKDNSLLASMAICYPVFTAINAAGQMVGIAASSRGGRKLGQKDYDGFKETALSGVVFGLIIYTVFIALAFILPEHIIKFIGVNNKTFEYSKQYSFYIFIFSIFTVFNMIFNNLLRACGKVMHSMVSMLISALLNVLLDAFFLFYLKFKIAGLITAVVVSQAAGCIYAIFVLLKNKAFKFNSSSLWPTFLEIIKIGLPTFLMQLGASTSVWILNSQAAKISEAALAGFGIGNKIYNLVFQTILGFTQGFLPFVAYNYGKKDTNRLLIGAKTSISFMVLLSTFFSLVFFTCGKIIVSIFSGDKNVAVFSYKSLIYHALTLCLVAIIQVLTVYFQGTKKPMFAAVLSLLRQAVFLIILSVYSAKFFNGFLTVALPQPISDALTFIVLIIGLLIIKRNSHLKKVKI